MVAAAPCNVAGAVPLEHPARCTSAGCWTSGAASAAIWRTSGNNGVGVDHNPESVAIARARGLTAFTSDEFPTDGVREAGQCFDSMLLAHVVEHVDPDFAVELVRMYLPYVKPGGHVLFITPQERGYAQRLDARRVHRLRRPAPSGATGWA